MRISKRLKPFLIAAGAIIVLAVLGVGVILLFAGARLEKATETVTESVSAQVETVVYPPIQGPIPVEGGRAVVHDARGLLQVLQPGITIQLAPGGDYDLYSAAAAAVSNKYFDQGVIIGVDDTTIEAFGDQPVEVITGNGWRPALSFRQCAGINLRNLRLGHKPELKGGCTGDVVALSACRDITIDHCELFGCGLCGLKADAVTGLVFIDSSIVECAQEIMFLHESSNLMFTRSRFLANGGNVTTHQCKNVKFTSCVLIADDRPPSFFDLDQTAVLTDADTIGGEMGGYTSRHFSSYDDWLSNVTLEDVWFSRSDVYESNLDLFQRLRALLGDELDAVGIRASYNAEPPVWEIDIRPRRTTADLTFQDVSRAVRQLSGARDSLDQTKAARFIIRFLAEKETLIEAATSKMELLAFLAPDNEALLDGFADIRIVSSAVNPGGFFAVDGRQLGGAEAIDILQGLIAIKREVDDEMYINGGDFQEFVYREARYCEGILYHLVDLRQKEPLLGDFVYYITVGTFKVDAGTGRAYYLGEFGECELAAISVAIKSAIVAYAKTNYKGPGLVEEDKSVLIPALEESGRKLIDVEVFDEDGPCGMVLFELALTESGWKVIKIGRIRSFYGEGD